MLMAMCPTGFSGPGAKVVSPFHRSSPTQNIKNSEHPKRHCQILSDKNDGDLKMDDEIDDWASTSKFPSNSDVDDVDVTKNAKRRKVQKCSISSQYFAKKKSQLQQIDENLESNYFNELFDKAPKSPSLSMDQITMDLERKTSSASNSHKISFEEEAGSGAAMPQRKKGLFLSGTAQSASGAVFAAELEALRKESTGSSASNFSSTHYNKNSTTDTPNYHPRMNIMRNKPSVNTNDDFIRKMSTVSMDEGVNRKESCYSDMGEELTAPETDAIPHINLGKNFQARVKKWADREITIQERAALPDRDEVVFDASVIDHLPQSASQFYLQFIIFFVVAAYETLACSMAVPKPGRNKELALHILMENQGNIQAAVMDLLRSDTLDWEQYPIIYNTKYVDTDNWTMENINRFQDAIYRSEKDFHQLGNRTVKECVAFYYTWKKACPDDYRKLRNLRRKRQLLQQILLPQSGLNKSLDNPHLAISTDDEDDFSETESSDSTNIPSYSAISPPHSQQIMDSSTRLQPLNIDTSRDKTLNSTFSNLISPVLHGSNNHLSAPELIHVLRQSPSYQQQNQQETMRNSYGSSMSITNSPRNHHLINSNSAFNTPATSTPLNIPATTGYPWLHGENGLFPSPNNSAATPNDTSSMLATSYGANSLNGSTGASSGAGSLTDLSGEIGNTSFAFLPKPRPANPTAKKGAQPSADGFFHCRLCEKRFEKVKSLNAHMKSHAMKARAEAEAQAQQLQQQQNQQLQSQNPQQQQMQQNHQNNNRFANTNVNKTMDLTSQEQKQLQQILQDSAALDDVSPLNLCQSSVAAALGLNLQNSGGLPAATKMNILNALNAATRHQQQLGANNSVAQNSYAAKQAAAAAQQQQQFLVAAANLHQQQQQLDMAATLQQLHNQHNQQLNSFVHNLHHSPVLGGGSGSGQTTPSSQLTPQQTQQSSTTISGLPNKIEI